jgi:hypothetical protein
MSQVVIVSKPDDENEVFVVWFEKTLELEQLLSGNRYEDQSEFDNEEMCFSRVYPSFSDAIVQVRDLCRQLNEAGWEVQTPA